ncbi:hypothetical protein DM02DRAFT_327252 [Periconia macrospinosa]|uniref:Uncharacterized protein n=1 Tax=Periconia macrospinosa TaxID=97972 RepID=A0A2V1EDW2_9PLEO|nr:hypothetical protein DM02DRAFT_327252 [Periconia macrospinosa]
MRVLTPRVFLRLAPLTRVQVARSLRSLKPRKATVRSFHPRSQGMLPARAFVSIQHSPRTGEMSQVPNGEAGKGSAEKQRPDTRAVQHPNPHASEALLHFRQLLLQPQPLKFFSKVTTIHRDHLIRTIELALTPHGPASVMESKLPSEVRGMVWDRVVDDHFSQAREDSVLPDIRCRKFLQEPQDVPVMQGLFGLSAVRPSFLPAICAIDERYRVEVSRAFLRGANFVFLAAMLNLADDGVEEAWFERFLSSLPDGYANVRRLTFSGFSASSRFRVSPLAMEIVSKCKGLRELTLGIFAPHAVSSTGHQEVDGPVLHAADEFIKSHRLQLLEHMKLKKLVLVARGHLWYYDSDDVNHQMMEEWYRELGRAMKAMLTLASVWLDFDVESRGVEAEEIK